MKYSDFISQKLAQIAPVGISDYDALDHYQLFPHQTALVEWALKRGRSAIFADTGLGKTRIQVAWANEVQKTGIDVLILAPLAVAEQTVHEAESIGVTITHAREDYQIRPGINITNYDRLHKFDASRFGAVVLDESSIIKHHDAKTLKLLIEAFGDTPYKLCATATPAPNDWTELGTHAEFLGICSRSEMLSEYFVHDGGETQKWRLKGHARSEFWRWVASWGAMIRSPADLGFNASAYDLPPLEINEHIVKTDAKPAEGMLFAMEANTLSERRQARRDSMVYRVQTCADMVNQSDDIWIIWCELNAEGDALKKAIPDAVEIRGSDSVEHKEKTLSRFASGDIRVLITKPKIAGHGLNWQHCNQMGFVGVTDSFEAYYQAVRRCWRFGQDKQVNVHLFVSHLEGAVLANLQRKERDAMSMFEQLSAETKDAVQSAVLGASKYTNPYNAKTIMTLPEFI